MSTCQCNTFTMSPSVSSDFSVPIPLWDNIRGGLSKDIQLFNMWTEELETVDKGMNSQNISLMGIWPICGEWSGLCFPICFPACFSRPLSNRIRKIHDIMNDGEEITITDLDGCINAVYVIRNFEFDTIKGTNGAYKYMFEMEKVRDL